ncbi:hypothetical protein HKX48_001821 [Thoreauomyces humboldtii]|nr:hypothetical protein HKX48_001821 [Thoreauomyces humboldtii]
MARGQRTTPVRLLSLPSEILLQIFDELPTTAFHRVLRTCRQLHELPTGFPASIYVPRLRAVGVPVEGTISRSRNEFATLLRDATLWKLLEPAASGRSRRRQTAGPPLAAETRSYVAAIPGVGCSGLTCRIVGGSKVVLGVSPKVRVEDVETQDGRSIVVHDNAKWLDDDDGTDTNRPCQLVAVNEWRGGYEGGWCRLVSASDHLSEVASFRAMDTAHVAVTHHDLVASCTAWWSLSDPDDLSTSDDRAEIKLWRITSTGPRCEWTHVLPIHTRTRSVALTSSYVVAAIDAHPLPYILVLSTVTGRPMHSPTPCLQPVLAIHAHSTSIVVQSPGQLTVYVETGSSLHVVTRVDAGDMHPARVFWLEEGSDPVVMLGDMLHPDRLCVLRPRRRERTWFFARRLAGEDGVWCLFERDRKKGGEAGGELGVFWKPVILP